MMSEKRYKRFYVSESENQLTIYDNEGLDDYYHLGNDERDVKGICKLLNEQEQKIQRWKKLYEIKDAEVTARVDTLNKVCEYYLTEAQFKADTDPNQAVKEVINRILNTEVEK